MRSRFQAIVVGLILLPVSSLHADIITWDGDAGDGLWITATNWTGTPDNTAPAPGDTANISNGDTVSGNGLPSGNLPNGVTVNLTGNSTLTFAGAAFRMNNSILNVASGSSLTGGFWDLDGATISFEDGAIATMNDWEQKDVNVFNFELGAAGFTTLTPRIFRLGNGGLPADIANATYNVDLANYTGSTGIITLVDFEIDGASMDNATFQGAGGLNILNAGSYAANLQWNDATEAIELNITATSVPEPSSILLLSVGVVALGLRHRRRQWASEQPA